MELYEWVFSTAKGKTVDDKDIEKVNVCDLWQHLGAKYYKSFHCANLQVFYHWTIIVMSLK